jgi:hypothetical protein
MGSIRVLSKIKNSIVVIYEMKYMDRVCHPVRLAYQPPASSTFLSEQISHQQPASSTFLSEQISTSHQPPAKRTGCVSAEWAVGKIFKIIYFEKIPFYHFFIM